MTCQQTPKWHEQKEFTSGSELPNGGGGKTSKPIKSQKNLKSLVVKGFIGISCIIRTFRLHLTISTVIVEER